MKLLFLAVLLSAASVFGQTPAAFDIEGHRGARGLAPENTIPSFIKALEYGVKTLELDVVVSRDNKLVVSHEPWFSSAISLNKNGNRIPVEKQKEHNIYKMDYAAVKEYDVGSLGNRDFPEQRKMKTYKPLLGEVFRDINLHIKKNKLQPVKFNIEIKSNIEGDDVYHPAPTIFAKMVHDEIRLNKMEKQVIVQSFDVRPLRELRKFSVKLPLALLVSNKEGIEKNIEKLGFVPAVYSPHFSLIDEMTVKYARGKGMKIIPWTVNETADMEKMKKYDLDGIITDYPNRAVKIFRN